MAAMRTRLGSAAVVLGLLLAALFWLPGRESSSGDNDGRPAGSLPTVEESMRADAAVNPTVASDELREFDTDRHFACDIHADASLSQEDMEARVEQFRREARRRAESLGAAEDVDLRLAGALLSMRDDPGYVERLLAALALDPDHPLILERLLDACVDREDSAVCENHGIVDRAARVDGGNGEMWSIVAAYRLSRGNDDGALEALRRAASAGTHREYFIDFIRVAELGLAAAVDDLSYGERITEAMGRAGAFGSPWLSVYYECRERVAEDPLWRDGCLDFARHLEKHSQSLLNRGIAIGMQAMIAEETGDERALAAAQRRQLEYRAWRDAHLTTDGEIVLMGDERVLRQYLNEFDAHGEMAALRYLRDEVERLKRIPGYDPCRGESAPGAG